MDPDAPRTFYLSNTYGENPLSLRYAVDLTKPIFPTPASDGGPGSPFVIYHTAWAARGLVVAYRDENDESRGECAQ